MSAVTENSGSNNKEKDLSFIIQQYQVLSDRRINHNTLLWDVPSLLFVAQTFLWTMAFSSEIDPMIRCAISLISVIIAITSFQTFERNRLMEVVDAEQMYNIEKYFRNGAQGNVDYPAIIVHHQLKKRTFILRENDSEDKNEGKKVKQEKNSKKAEEDQKEYKDVEEFLKKHFYYKKHKRKWSLCWQSSVFLWKTVFISALIFSVGLLVYNTIIFWGECFV